MDAGLYRRVKGIVARALELECGERDAFVTEACGGDRELHREVARLLDQDDSLYEGFIERPFGIDDETRPDRPGAAPAPSPEPPETIGPFRVLELLGQGGMGAVYRCEQDEPVRREVAVKVIRADLTQPHAAARFDVERQALARLSHPNIARILQAGTTDQGFPYFAMEYCSGAAVTEFCDEHCMSLDERLELFISICGAVQHAHRQGIIHRDLKPSNIMVTSIDGRPSVKIIDFGIAKAFDEPETLELTGQRLVGTPAYMSPEALGLVEGADPDTRSDVFALGVVLYEMLVGMRPHPVDALAAYLSHIATEPTPSPSHRLSLVDPSTREEVAERRGVTPEDLHRQLQGDLDWIVATAVAREPDERYGSPEEFAADVRRFLDHLPVLASPPSLRYRATKFVRRHRALTALGAVAILAVVAGTVGTTVGMVRANEQARRASAEAERANDEAAVAREVSKFLVSLFEVSDPGRARGNSITAREILDRGADEIREGFGDRPLVKARFMLTIGDVFEKLGLYDQARPLLEEALEIREAELAPDHLDVAQSLHRLGWLSYRQGSFDEAEALYKSSLEIREAELGPNHSAVGSSLIKLADLYTQQGRYAEAEPLLRRSVEIKETEFGPDHPNVAVSLNNLAILFRNQERYDEAEPLFRRSLAIRETVLGSDHPHVASSLNNLANLYGAQGRYDEAEPLYERSLETLETVLGPDHPKVGHPLANLGQISWKQGRLQNAEQFFRRALELWESSYSSDHRSIGILLGRLAGVYRDQGRYEEAEPLYRRAIEILGAKEPGHRELRETLTDYAQLLRATGRVAEARELEARAEASSNSQGVDGASG